MKNRYKTGADRGPQAGSPPGVVVATGIKTQLNIAIGNLFVNTFSCFVSQRL